MDGAMDKGATKARARRTRLATWAVSIGLSVGLVALIASLQAHAYKGMIAASQRQLAGSASGVVRMVDQDIDASLGPLLALRNAVESADSGPLHARLAEVQARHPELPTFVALDADGAVVACTSVPLLNWRQGLDATRREALGASVRVIVVAGTDGAAPTIRVLVDSRVSQPAAFGTLIDAARIRDGMRRSMLGSTATMAVFSLDGRRFASNRDDLAPSWNGPTPAPGGSGRFDDDERIYAWAASARYPFATQVALDRNGIYEEWQRQARPAMFATLGLVLLLNIFAAIFDRAYRRQGRLVDALSRSARHLGDVQRTGHIGLWEADLGTGFIAWSGQVHEITGLPQAQVDGRRSTYFKLVHPDDQPAVTAWLELFEKGDGPYELEHRLCRPDGREVHVNLRATRLTSEDGKPIIAGTIGEITALHDARRRLRDTDRDLAASEAAYRQLMTRMPLPLLIVRDDRI
ncbi:MAG: PAS domain-containing protein, partial [Luteibacter sp.]